jgi:hypothetical protein
VVEAGGAEGVAGPGGVGEAGVFDELDHARWAGKALDRGGQVTVSGGLAGDEAAEFGEDGLEVEVVECAGEAFGLVAFEDAELTAGAQDAVEFGEALFVVGEVAEAEGGGDKIDGGVGEREVEGVGFDGDDVVGSEFFCAEREHLVGEVDGKDGGRFRVWGAVLEERQGHVAGSAAEIEGDGLGVLKDGTEEAGGAVPPPVVDAHGEEMVGAVVGGGDGVEHLLDVRGGGLLGGDAGGAGAGGAFVFGWMFDSHSTYVNALCIGTVLRCRAEFVTRMLATFTKMKDDALGYEEGRQK